MKEQFTRYEKISEAKTAPEVRERRGRNGGGIHWSRGGGEGVKLRLKGWLIVVEVSRAVKA